MRCGVARSDNSYFERAAERTRPSYTQASKKLSTFNVTGNQPAFLSTPGEYARPSGGDRRRRVTSTDAACVRGPGWPDAGSRATGRRPDSHRGRLQVPPPIVATSSHQQTVVECRFSAHPKCRKGSCPAIQATEQRQSHRMQIHHYAPEHAIPHDVLARSPT